MPWVIYSLTIPAFAVEMLAPNAALLPSVPPVSMVSTLSMEHAILAPTAATLALLQRNALPVFYNFTLIMVLALHAADSVRPAAITAYAKHALSDTISPTTNVRLAAIIVKSAKTILDASHALVRFMSLMQPVSPVVLHDILVRETQIIAPLVLAYTIFPILHVYRVPSAMRLFTAITKEFVSLHQTPMALFLYRTVSLPIPRLSSLWSWFLLSLPWFSLQLYTLSSPDTCERGELNSHNR